MKFFYSFLFFLLPIYLNAQQGATGYSLSNINSVLEITEDNQFYYFTSPLGITVRNKKSGYDQYFSIINHLADGGRFIAEMVGGFSEWKYVRSAAQLYFFDGTTFSLKKGETAFKLHEYVDDQIIVVSDGGFKLYKDTVVVFEQAFPEDIPAGFVRAVAVDWNSEAIYFGARIRNEFYITTFENGQFTPTLNINVSFVIVNSMMVGSNGQLWLGANDGLYRLENDELEFIDPAVIGVSYGSVSNLQESPQREITFTFDDEDGKVIGQPSPPGIAHEDTTIEVQSTVQRFASLIVTV